MIKCIDPGTCDALNVLPRSSLSVLCMRLPALFSCTPCTIAPDLLRLPGHRHSNQSLQRQWPAGPFQFCQRCFRCASQYDRSGVGRQGSSSGRTCLKVAGRSLRGLTPGRLESCHQSIGRPSLHRKIACHSTHSAWYRAFLDTGHKHCTSSCCAMACTVKSALAWHGRYHNVQLLSM